MNKSRKIGIGLLTYQRPECKKLFLSQLKKNDPFYTYKLFIEEDNNSISDGTNKCLKALSDCDYIFLFNDDCFPIRVDWDLFFINAGHHHLLYMNNSHVSILDNGTVTTYKDCSGCFLFLTKEVFKTVGYFNTAYTVNGMEHKAYSERIRKVLKEDGFKCLNDTDKYLYSLDLQNDKDWKVWHKSLITPNQRVMASNLNMPIFLEEINGEKIHYGNT